GCAAGDIFCRFLRMRDGEPHAALRQAVSGAVACHGPAAIAAETGRQLDRLLAGRRSLDDIIDRLPPLVVGALSGLPDAVLPEIAMLAATF
ncbi:hypothetical protein ACSLVQ_28335, partial [Klebsiella pneumoniae]|uniref:hypothetical protein n=1 Tax=Klebsiella pneumoniae TaxID=573 RepID=UPI003EE2F2C6